MIPTRWRFQGDSAAELEFVPNETPVGAINGVNTSYTISQAPETFGGEPGILLYRNGILMLRVADPPAASPDEYSLIGTTITTGLPPANADTLKAYFFYPV